MACPGPVRTELFSRVSGGVAGQLEARAPRDDHVTFMPADRCARLMLVAIANRVAECWLFTQPLLTLFYIGLRHKTVTNWLLRRVMSEQLRHKFLKME